MAVPGLDPGYGCQPEWAGQQSAKFVDRGSCKPIARRVVDTYIRNGDTTSLARNGFGQYFSDTRGLIGTESKKILPCPGSQVFEWKPSKRSTAEPGHDHYEKPEGRRRVESAPGKSLAIREKRHVRQVESKEEFTDRPLGPRPVVRENGMRAAEQPAREVDISFEMQRKVPHYCLRDQRNGIGCKTHGDKAYKHPEYSDKFYKVGSLVVGSSFHRGHYKKTEPRNATSVQLVEVERRGGPVMTFEEKQQKEMMDDARMEVEELTMNWENSVLKTLDAKYEAPSDSEDEAPGATATA
jgi:hypothetical protein